MDIISSLFSGAVSFIKDTLREGKELIKEAVHVAVSVFASEKSAQKASDAAGRIIDYFTKAEDIVEEERELRFKERRDNFLNEYDRERLNELSKERQRLKAEIDAAAAAKSAKELADAADMLIATEANNNEAAANVAILATKECPVCGSPMRLYTYAEDIRSRQQKLKWVCTRLSSSPCPSIYYKRDDASIVLRKPTNDLDGDTHVIHAHFNKPDVIKNTHKRLRESLGERDGAVTCPIHLTPMKLVEKEAADGLMLTSYHYVCRGVDDDGRACRQRVPVSSMQQVSALMRRRDGKGILD